MFRKFLMCTALVTAIFNANATANSGTYIGVAAGVANQPLSFNQSAFGINGNGSNTVNTQLGMAGRLFGGYNFNKYNGVEAGVSYNTGTTYNYPDGSGGMTSNAAGVDISYIPMLPISNSNWSVFGRVGVEYGWINSSGGSDCNCSTSISPLNPSGSSFTDELGAGMRYKISNRFTYKIEWISNGLLFPIGINSGNTDVGSWSQQTFQTGVSYHF